jgi:hypothetical protein
MQDSASPRELLTSSPKAKAHLSLTALTPLHGSYYYGLSGPATVEDEPLAGRMGKVVRSSDGRFLFSPNLV